MPEVLRARVVSWWLGWTRDTPESRASREAVRASELRHVAQGIWGDVLGQRAGVSTDAAERAIDLLVAAGLLRRNRSGLAWAPDEAIPLLNRLAELA